VNNVLVLLRIKQLFVEFPAFFVVFLKLDGEPHYKCRKAEFSHICAMLRNVCVCVGQYLNLIISLTVLILLFFSVYKTFLVTEI
jgi:hypothetical protein